MHNASRRPSPVSAREAFPLRIKGCGGQTSSAGQPERGGADRAFSRNGKHASAKPCNPLQKYSRSGGSCFVLRAQSKRIAEVGNHQDFPPNISGVPRSGCISVRDCRRRRKHVPRSVKTPGLPRPAPAAPPRRSARRIRPHEKRKRSAYGNVPFFNLFSKPASGSCRHPAYILFLP